VFFEKVIYWEHHVFVCPESLLSPVHTDHTGVEVDGECVASGNGDNVNRRHFVASVDEPLGVPGTQFTQNEITVSYFVERNKSNIVYCGVIKLSSDDDDDDDDDARWSCRCICLYC